MSNKKEKIAKTYSMSSNVVDILNEIADRESITPSYILNRLVLAVANDNTDTIKYYQSILKN
jgi:hypothetical protein